MGGYDYAFEFDPTKHRSLSKATRRIWDTSKGGAAPAITQEQAAFLALGLKKFSMDYRVGDRVSTGFGLLTDASNCSGWAI